MGITRTEPSPGDTGIYMKGRRQKIRTTEETETQEGKHK